MHKQPDSEILEGLKAGDSAAFDALFTKYYEMLCLNAYWYIRNQDEAQDLVQAFFLDVWDKKLYLNLEGEVKGYLFQAVKNRSLNLLRQLKAQREKQAVFSQLQDDTETVYEKTPDYTGQLNATLDEMTCQKRAAIQMVYLQGKRYQEAADEMGISLNSLKTHLKRGLKILRHAIIPK
ncbi:RNA polymerase sigma-70 factor, ECF subfamily [Chitinophaga jiangningensis]|uniref:RNA polymerase sigma-70 factor, ECF subfamily n=1 Tax=Chitinophaga jiangningensis TaxID=1419482 RepID=A0A1M7LTI2_9BACT|nr:sigma-70 family RNA polymerase sigma factor [Chitinophaga jiangningensis]SHM81542.1 RNA polymerase sigma-70 factor, ECF subfamily [Chitinophaga jiangningensis]